MRCLPRTRGRAGRSVRPSGRLAFTLIELLTVIAIIAILASIVIGVGRHASETGKIARTKAELAAIATALEGYKRQYGDYPRTSNATEMLQALVGKRGPNGESIEGRVVLDLVVFTTDQGGAPLTNASLSLVDPWGNAYVYVYKVPSSGWTNSSFVLYSVGADGNGMPSLRTGGYPQRDADTNLDNIYATL